jgi:hypothetical protein
VPAGKRAIAAHANRTDLSLLTQHPTEDYFSFASWTYAAAGTPTTLRGSQAPINDTSYETYRPPIVRSYEVNRPRRR